MIAVGILGVMLIAFSIPAFAAQEPADEPEGSPTVFSFIEEETVSTAIRREQPISQAPSNVYVISAEDIRQSGAPDIPTILRRIPGIEVMQVTGADFNVSARGNNQLFANKMLVLVDGRSVYVDVQGFLFWKGLPVTLPDIKQIEVIKGPVAALYGFNAFDGVVNIITKSPKEMDGTTLQLGGGEIGTVLTSAVHAGAAGNVKYRVSGGYEQPTNGGIARRWPFVPINSTVRLTTCCRAGRRHRSQAVSSIWIPMTDRWSGPAIPF